MTAVNDGDVIQVEVPLSRATLTLEVHFADVRKRLGHGDGWMATTHFLSKRYDATGVTADDAKERLIAQLQSSPDVQAWAAQEGADADAASDEGTFLRGG
jgi:hypothetical protein